MNNPNKDQVIERLTAIADSLKRESQIQSQCCQGIAPHRFTQSLERSHHLMDVAKRLIDSIPMEASTFGCELNLFQAMKQAKEVYASVTGQDSESTTAE